MKQLLPLLLALLLVFSGCGNQKQTETPTQTTIAVVPGEHTIGISLPDETWADTGSALITKLENAGYHTALNYAQNDPQTQADQIKTMADTGVSCIIVAPVDPLTLTEEVDYTAQKGIKLMAYHRLLSDATGLSFYVAPDYRAMGKAVAQELVASLDSGKSYTAELFMGNPTDPGSVLYWEGIMEVLKPFFETGTLRNLSGRLAFEDVCVADGTAETAQNLCAARLENAYAETPLDICIGGTDKIAGGIITALENGGYTQENWPIITGSGCYPTPVVQQKLTLTAYTATDSLCAVCVELVNCALSGKTPKLDKELTVMSNTAATVPSYLGNFQLIKDQTTSE